MFSLSNHSSQKSENSAQMLMSNKRDRFRVQIRKTDRKERQLERRSLLMNSLNNLDMEILIDLARAEESSLSQENRQELVNRLDECVTNKDILLKVSELRLVKRLTKYLRAANNLDYKYRIVKILLNLIYYSRQTFQEFIEQNIVDFVLTQFNKQPFSESRHYFILLLNLIRNLSAEVQMNFNLYLKDVSFCGKICTKLEQERVQCPQAVRDLMRIRANLLQTKESLPSSEMVEQTLEYLKRDALGESSEYEYYLTVINALIKTVDEDELQQLLTNRFLLVQDKLLDIMEFPLPEYQDIQQGQGYRKLSLIIKMLSCVKSMAQFNNSLLNLLENLRLPKKQLFYWSLNCPNSTVSKYSLKVFSYYVQRFVKRYPALPLEQIQNLIKIILEQHWNEKQFKETLKIVNTLLLNKIWTQATECLLKNNILIKLEELLLSESCKKPQILVLILSVYKKLLDYGEKQENGNKILRKLQNGGIVNNIMALQMHQNRDIATQVNKISEQYFSNLKQISGFEADS